MYHITHDVSTNCVSIKHKSYGVFALVNLNHGGSLQELILNNIELIASLNPLPYIETYASAILFPFANRVEDGKYGFNGDVFQLDINNIEENNAIHGLVYNKLFSIKSQFADDDQADLVLEYDYNELNEGFPFPFTIQLKYTFTKNRLKLKVFVQNKGDSPFPYTIGWHPYFYSEQLNTSTVEFKSGFKLEMDNRNIGIGLQNIAAQERLSLKDKTLDDCWKLDSDPVVFKTPQYSLKLSSSEPHGFLQIYTPSKKNTIAIEPTSGVSNSFNTKIGLKTLKPNDQFEIIWRLTIDSN
jgi:aldose 1-epimerase